MRATMSPTTRRRATAIVLALTLVLAACGPDESADDETAELEARLAEVEQERDEARADADELTGEVDRLAAEVERLETELADAPDETAEPAPLRTPEGLMEQLRLRFGHGDVPEGFDPGSTGWAAFDLPAPAEDTYASPGEAAVAVVAELEAEGLGQDVWEVTTRVLLDAEDEDAADLAVLSWGWADDAVIGRDVRVPLTRTADGEWTTGDAEARHHCLRGVTDDDQCV